MQAAEPDFSNTQTTRTNKPNVLFVDDEKRVLNSMRAMFRRDYNLFLTTRGDEALKIIGEHDIDVVVADQRMPIMTGVEVLSAVKKQSPDTVRILLTGYADLEAIEGAMNDGEVFRFLSKPCAADELRGTIKLATQIASETAGYTDSDDEDDETLFASAATNDRSLQTPKHGLVNDAKSDTRDQAVNDELSQDNVNFSGTVVLDEPKSSAPSSIGKAQAIPKEAPPEAPSVEIVMSGDAHHEIDGSTNNESDHVVTAVLDAAPVLAPPEDEESKKQNQGVRLVGTGKYKVSIVVFSPDETFAKSIGRSLQGYFYTFYATNIAHLMNAISKITPAVLITDVSEDTEVIQQLTAQLKQIVPQMVTMVASQHRDADLMVKLINYGQVFRIIDKPLSSTACKRHVREAIKKHVQLRDNPELIQRHQVIKSEETSKLPASIGRLFGRLSRARTLWSKKTN